MKLIKKYFFSFFFLFFVLADQLFRALMILSGIAVQSGQLQYMYIVLFTISIILWWYDIHHKIQGISTLKIIMPTIVICVLFFSTQLFYPYVLHNYSTSFLTYGVACIPATITGVHFARKNYMPIIDVILPYFIIPLGYLIGTVGYKYALLNSIVSYGDESGLDYQIISYYMASLYAFSGYYIFFSSARSHKSFKIFKYILLISMLFFAIMCVLSGGRGGMVFIVVVTIYMFYALINSGKVKKITAVFIIIGIAIAFISVASALNIWDSAGFTRVSTNITQDDERLRLVNLVFKSFYDSPLFGHGIGSVWWEVGYYSHNLVLDLLVETGLVGAVIILGIICKMGFKLLRISKQNSSYILIMVVLLEALVHGAFSGYWLNTPNLWLVYGFAFALPKNQKTSFKTI